MRKVLLSTAPIDGAAKKFDPVAAAEDIIECHRLGAAQMHLHVRDLNGDLTADTLYVRNTLEMVRSETDMILELSTGGISDLSIEERCRACYEPLAELTSLNVSTINLGDIPYINRIEDFPACPEEHL